MFTLAIFSCFQHSENIYVPTLGSLISTSISIFHITTQDNEPADAARDSDTIADQFLLLKF